MTIYHLAHMFKRTYSRRELLEQYVFASNQMEKDALGLALDGYPMWK